MATRARHLAALAALPPLLLLLTCAAPRAHAAVTYNPQLWNSYNKYTATGIHPNLLFSKQLFPLDFGWNVEVS
jgi:hypothetical protein